jgi:hypothetical protein
MNSELTAMAASETAPIKMPGRGCAAGDEGVVSEPKLRSLQANFDLEYTGSARAVAFHARPHQGQVQVPLAGK